MMKIEDYPNYSINESGTVINITTNKVLKWRKTLKGYCYVTLYKEGVPKNYFIHRLVALAFIPNPDNLPCVNHIDEDKTNNCVNNLEWCTQAYNNNYGTRTERSCVKVAQYSKDGEFIKQYSSVKEAANAVGVGPTCISKVLNSSRYTAGGYKWIKI